MKFYVLLGTVLIGFFAWWSAYSREYRDMWIEIAAIVALWVFNFPVSKGRPLIGISRLPKGSKKHVTIERGSWLKKK